MEIEKIKEVLKGIKDPEFGFNIVDLGFVTNIKMKDKKIIVKLVLTTPLCPLANYFFSKVEEN